ncbi:MAG: phosphatase PAP2 family protein [Thermoleophilia bacterium]|nr:phosphatase PAP2 family protein [Thermoleophilia bacterium]
MAPLLGALRGRHLALLTIGYFAVTSFLMAMAGGWPTPDKVAIVGLVLAFLVAKPLTFLKDWMPFVILLAAYEYLRGLVPSLGWAVHVQPLIHADEFLFGRLPTVILQDILFVADHPTWYDYVFTLTYLLHFTLPLGFALLLWTRDRSSFHRFITALTVLSFAGFLTYLFYPAMPPWLASYNGIIPPLHDVMVRTTDLFKRGPGLPTLYVIMSPNMVAAMPSLHAAYPMMVYLYAVAVFGKKGHLFLPYVLIVWIGIVYTANHWVIDVIAGALYALVVFLGTELFWRRRERASAAVAREREPAVQEGSILAEPASEGSIAVASPDDGVFESISRGPTPR